MSRKARRVMKENMASFDAACQPSMDIGGGIYYDSARLAQKRQQAGAID